MPLATSRAWGNSGAANLLGNTTAIFGPTPVAGKRLSLEVAWTGTPTGVLTLECSFDGQVWRTIPGATAQFTAGGQAQPAGTASSGVYNWVNVPGQMVRLKYTRTSGTGTATVRGVYGEE